MKKFWSFLKEINPSHFASAITFYLLFMILPFLQLLTNVLSYLEVIKNPPSLNITMNSSIFFIFSALFASSKVIHMLAFSTDLIYQNTPKRKVFKLKLKSFFFVFFLLVFIVIGLILIVVIMHLIKVLFNVYFHLLHLVLLYIVTSVLVGTIYRFIVPFKVKFKEVLYPSFVVCALWYLITFVFYNLVFKLYMVSYSMLYGIFASFFVFLLWLYLMVLIFIYVICIDYFFAKKNQESKLKKSK